MIKSWLIKLGMLAMTMGVVFWIGWQVPQVSVKPAALVDRSEAALVPSGVERERGTNVLGQASIRPAAATTQMENNAKPVDGTMHRRLLDLNRASTEDFESLPGIGPVLAQRLMVFRKSNGGFHTVDELRQVKGIGRKKFDRVRPLVTVTAPSTEKRTERPLS